MALKDDIATLHEIQKLGKAQAEKLKKKYIDSHKEAKDDSNKQGTH